jgi:hypothetical protein
MEGLESTSPNSSSTAAAAGGNNVSLFPVTFTYQMSLGGRCGH